MNVWILDDRGISLFYKSYVGLPVDEVLVSGLLAALNQFILTQFEQPIESIDMAGYKWIYIYDEKEDLIFVASDSKNVNAEALRSRLEVIKQKFMNKFLLPNQNWREEWVGDAELFRPFEKKLDKYYAQWTQAESMTSSADFFDVLGIFQQILNIIRKAIERQIRDGAKEIIYESIEDQFNNFKNQLYIQKFKELSKISFSRDVGFNVISINPMNCDISVVQTQIIYLIRGVLKIIRENIGFKESLNILTEEKVFNYLFNNIVVLKRHNLDTFLLQLFLTK